jgi:hypothetical protein
MDTSANHSREWKFDLQLFGEGEPADLTPSGEPAGEPGADPTPPADPPAESTPAEPPAPPQTIKVKYNHQELELPIDEAVTHIQKGMNYDKAIERARQEAAQEAAQKARDAVIAEMGYEWKGKPITTEAEYRQALQEKEIEDKLRLQYSNLPDEIIDEILANRRFREETLAEKKAREEAERKAQEEKDFAARRDTMLDEFLHEFPDYDTEEKWKAIPKEVWAEADKWLKSGGREGRRLADALAKYNLKQMQAQNQAAEANQANAASSTGSVKGQGKAGTFFTREQVANMSREEIRANYAAIKESEKRWK